MSLLGSEPVADAICSRAGCRGTARWRIEWRNPRIHTADRTKTWVACDEHRDYLQGFLEARSFPVAVAPLARREAEAPSDPCPPTDPATPAVAKTPVDNGDTPATDASARRVASSARVFAPDMDAAPRPGIEER